MVTDELVNYLKEQITLGRNADVIKPALISQGWSEIDIKEAFIRVGLSQSEQLPKRNINQTDQVPINTMSRGSDKKTLVVILLLIFLYPIGVICMYILTKWKWWAKLLITLPLILIPILLMLSVNPQEALDKAAKLKTECANSCKSDTNYDVCYSQCVSDRK